MNWFQRFARPTVPNVQQSNLPPTLTGFAYGMPAPGALAPFHGTPSPVPIPPPARMWNKAMPNMFPAQSIVSQPRNITVSA